MKLNAPKIMESGYWVRVRASNCFYIWANNKLRKGTVLVVLLLFEAIQKICL
jgi:hypothetical protein